jgi:hypothetical protein
MPTYDPNEAQELVIRLQKRAAAVMIYFPVQGAALGAGTMFFLSRGNNVLVTAGALLGGILGFNLARMRSLALKVQAQSLLCQVKIEENTRK